MTKSPKPSILEIFMQLLLKLRQDSWIRMLKTVIKVRIRCPFVFYEEIIAVFQMKNVSNGYQK